MVSGAQQGSPLSSRWLWHLRKPWRIKGTLVSTHCKVLTQFDSPNLGPELIGWPRAQNSHPTVQPPRAYLRALKNVPKFGWLLKNMYIIRIYSWHALGKSHRGTLRSLRKTPQQPGDIFAWMSTAGHKCLYSLISRVCKQSKWVNSRGNYRNWSQWAKPTKSNYILSPSAEIW